MKLTPRGQFLKDNWTVIAVMIALFLLITFAPALWWTADPVSIR